ARLRAHVAFLGRALEEVVDVLLGDLRVLEARAALRVVDRLVGRDALGVVGIVERQAGEELAALLGGVGGHVLVDRGGELALLERLGEVVALVRGEAVAAREERVGESLQVARLAELEGYGGGVHRLRAAYRERHARERLGDELGAGGHHGGGGRRAFQRRNLRARRHLGVARLRY